MKLALADQDAALAFFKDAAGLETIANCEVTAKIAAHVENRAGFYSYTSYPHGGRIFCMVGTDIVTCDSAVTPHANRYCACGVHVPPTAAPTP